MFGATLRNHETPSDFVRSLSTPVFATWGVLVISVFMATEKPI